MSSYAISDHRDLVRAWQAVLGRLELELTDHNFNTWLRDTRPIRLDGQTLVVEARSTFSCDWLNQRLNVVVCRATSHILGEDLNVRFTPRGAALLALTPLEEELPTAGSCHSSLIPHPSSLVVGNLNSTYTFDRYVPGEGNRLAFDCCASLFDVSAVRISPVVIFGASGLGKTHLLHAVACRAASEGWLAACLSAEEFTTRYMTSLRRGNVEEFQLSVRSVRLLAIDDLQYLAGKKGTQDELVHTIDTVTNAGGHVVVASERHPFELDLPDRLASRLAGGIATRVEPFMAGERRAYVERLARDLRVALPAWAVERIAGAETPSVRVLQGAVHAALALRRCDRLDLPHLDAELTRISATELAPPGAADRAILETVARYFSVSFDDLAGRSRKPAVAGARAAAVAALKDRGRSLSEIASVLGNRDRSTISQLADRGHALLADHPQLRARLAS